MPRVAQQFYLDLLEFVDVNRSYKAPHAYRPTPSRRSRRVAKFKLFKGYRP